MESNFIDRGEAEIDIGIRIRNEQAGHTCSSKNGVGRGRVSQDEPVANASNISLFRNVARASSQPHSCVLFQSLPKHSQPSGNSEQSPGPVGGILRQFRDISIPVAVDSESLPAWSPTTRNGIHNTSCLPELLSRR